MTNLDIEFVLRTLSGLPPRKSVVEVGGRCVNGTVAGAFAETKYVCVDLYPGDGVDVVADAFTWRPDEPADTVVCLNVIEHLERQMEFLDALLEMLEPGGVLILSFPIDPWPEHSAIDGAALRQGEYYHNPDSDAVWEWAKKCKFSYMEEEYPLEKFPDFPQCFVVVKK